MVNRFGQLTKERLEADSQQKMVEFFVLKMTIRVLDIHALNCSFNWS